MAKASVYSLMSSTRSIESFTKGTSLKKQTRVVQKFTDSAKFKAKTGDIKKYKKNTKITNSNTKLSNQKFSPSNPVPTAVDKKMKFHLNMEYGSNYGNTANYFDRLYSVYPNKELDSVCQYVFMVRPDLNILKSKGKELVSLTQAQINSGYYSSTSPSNDLLFRRMLSKYPNILRSLTSELSSSHDFIPFLVGRTESLQLADYVIKDYKMNQPYTNFNLPYASHALESMTGGEFEITFRDDSDLRIHKMFQTWLHYINGVTLNRFGPKIFNIRHNKIDYATSVYLITCKADGETIIDYAKYTGAFPVSVPNSNMGFNLRGGVDNKITIPFHYFLQEVSNPYILIDFNKNAHVVNSNKEGYIPVYRSGTIGSAGFKDKRSSARKKIDNNLEDAEVSFRKSYPISLGSGNGLVGCPYIYKDKSTNEWKLRWKRIKNLSPS